LCLDSEIGLPLGFILVTLFSNFMFYLWVCIAGGGAKILVQEGQIGNKINLEKLIDIR